MRRHPHRALLATVATLLTVGLASPVQAASNEWMVYLGGGLEPIEGGWSERQGRVIFTKLGGTLTSVRFDQVDLPASAFITWQLGGRRQVPPRPELEEVDPLPEGTGKPACIDAQLVQFFDGESLEVRIDGKLETIHVACLDTPESRHKYASLGWFGRATTSTVEIEVPEGTQLCLTEQTPLQRDGSDHRIVSVGLPDGRDYATEVIAGGFGLLRPKDCRAGAHYRAAEDSAIRGRYGLWGERGEEPAFAAANLGVAGAPDGGGGGRRARGGG